MICNGKCVKKYSYFYVGLFLIASLAEILFGALLLVFVHLTKTADLIIGLLYVTVPPLLLHLAGIILLSLTVLGCCGISKEIASCVHLYSIILVVLAIFQISTGILTIYPTNISGGYKEELKIGIDEHLNKMYMANSTTFYSIQALMECCGKWSPFDMVMGDSSLLPQSCCSPAESSCTLNSYFVFDKGCSTVLTNFIILQNDIVGYVSILVGVVEISASIIGICLGYRLIRDGTTFYDM